MELTIWRPGAAGAHDHAGWVLDIDPRKCVSAGDCAERSIPLQRLTPDLPAWAARSLFGSVPGRFCAPLDTAGRDATATGAEQGGSVNVMSAAVSWSADVSIIWLSRTGGEWDRRHPRMKRQVVLRARKRWPDWRTSTSRGIWTPSLSSPPRSASPVTRGVSRTPPAARRLAGWSNCARSLPGREPSIDPSSTARRA
jgi:hypothetical protein